MANRRELRKNVALAIALSAGLHALAAVALDLSPGGWRFGVAPSFTVDLRPIPLSTAQGEAQRRAAAPAKRNGIVASKVREGSSTPLAPHFYRDSEVTAPAIPLSTGPLVYPELAYVSKLAGSVRARVLISEQGVVEGVEVIEARPRPGIFEEAALEALRQVRYKPAEISGERVKSQKLIEVKFNPHADPFPGPD